MEELVYIGAVSNGKIDEHKINISMDAIYEVVCNVDTNCKIIIHESPFKGAMMV
ncbi:hypothetical protein ABPS01_00025 [Streptococcus sp. ZJ151]|uniref:hypothetical protein n=1 Tax=Streptococcus jiangjianxini TaxID=3161189 RepID=UPI0032EBF2EE